MQTKDLKGSIIFHSGTIQDGQNVVSNGGRVLAVTSYGSNICTAVKQSNQILERLNFEGMYHRSDIGYEFY